ncbi:MAG: hypothetical protein MUQ30_02875, partial [Anaerolineae bacterium]|nr:hypothetical protein [Anaerolineae bacterium]
MKDSEQNIEWLFINIRWLLLLAVASVIGLNVAVTEGSYPVAALALLVVSSVANVTAMIIYLQNSWRPALQNLLLVHDILIAIGFIAISQDLRHQLLFISLVPIITAALRNSWSVSMLVMFGVVGAYWAIAGVDVGFSPSSSIFEIVSRMFLPLTNGAVLIIAGLAVGRIGVRIKQSFVADHRAREKETNKELRMAHQRAQLIFGLASTLSATLNHERILEAALDISHAGIQGLFSDSSQLSQIGMILLFG